ncbi:aminotransferase class I/II-fold pyridoxal phosphate-dependent enzyme [Rhizobium wuzhouense]|uniref:Histidinol-phosphate aminotransferase n=1 Tax=Rhizobium wuzhouense TaxID=1986026 RepID=A0ABX5NR96_9HYPH|nr:aminotransferase class I/II-fold pyridoxal phosphate-dependent enzyme [Rhizobium wuzhouense]PYB72283.1 histidinol-phosphate aminotransferase [Rhizobium wuzhouense]
MPLGKHKRDEVPALKPYNTGLTIEEVRVAYQPAHIAKLGSNENPFGPSPKAVEAMNALGSSIALYPSFPLHEDYATTMGATVEHVVIGDDFSIPLDALIEAAGRAKMLIFSNPMNPVGVWLGIDAFRRLISSLSTNTRLVVDEAYFEYAALEEDFPSALEELKGSGLNWLVLRTLSKAYGLAGLRIGYGIASSPDFKSYLDRARTPLNVNAADQAAAIAAIADEDHVRAGVRYIRSERQRLMQKLTESGFKVASSAGNFLFIDAGQLSDTVAAELLTTGTIVKPWRQQGFRDFIRVSIGKAEDNDKFVAEFLASSGKGE